MYQISVKSSFSAAHNLREYQGKCERLHGHNWQVEVRFASLEINKEGMVIDFTEAKKTLKSVLDVLDHSYINEVSPFDKINPTSESIAKYIFDAMKKELKEKSLDITLDIKRVDVWETDESRASYYEEN